VSLFRKQKEPPFDFTKTVLAALDRAIDGGASRAVVIEKLEQIVAVQQRIAATSYRSSFLEPDYNRPRQ
jgi:hypothetical protein